jgi:16S rRNA U1498 N3-methylase RsmE
MFRDRKRFVVGRIRLRLGPLILRAETAALAGLAVLAQAWQP